MLKLTVRSLVSAIRLREAQTQFMNDIVVFDHLVDLMETCGDEEIIANSLKVVRIIFKDVKYMFYVSSQSPATINRIIQVLTTNGQNSFIG